MNAENYSQAAARAEPDDANEVSDREQDHPIVLSIAGFDPTSGAGITADLKVFAAFGLYGMSCATALTIQSTLGVRALEPVPSATVAATLQMLSEDVVFAGIKLGMLATAGNCLAVEKFLNFMGGIPVVLDPVFRSSSGHELLSPEGVRLVREQLLPRVSWITPNLDELATLTGRSITGRDEVPAAAEELRSIAAQAGSVHLNVLVTGGHLNPPEDYLLTTAGDSGWIPGERVQSDATHGTGCALSSALLCRLVAGDDTVTAATRAKEYVHGALRAAYPIGRGKGPMNHLYLRRLAVSR